MLAFDLANKNKQLAAIQYIRLLGLKNPDSVQQESDGSFSNAIKLTKNMGDSEFDWSDFDDAQVVDDNVDFE